MNLFLKSFRQQIKDLKSLKEGNEFKYKKKIQNYKKKNSIRQIISVFISHWAAVNSISPDMLYTAKEYSLYRGYYDDALYKNISSSIPIISIKDIETVFENLIDLEEKKTHGAVYTPDYIIDSIINNSLDFYKGPGHPVLCDPCCGSGGFLIRATDILSKTFHLDEKDVCMKYVKGIDINPQAVSCAKLILEILLLSKGFTPPDFDNNIICADTLLSSKKELTSKTGTSSQGFDIIATNPPYVKLQNMDDSFRMQLSKTYSEYAKGSFSLAMLFLIKGYELLSPKGVLGYITQNNLFTSLSGENVRKYLIENKAVHTIIDFGHNRIFKTASAYTCIIFLTKNENKSLQYYSCSKPEKKLGSIKKNEFSQIPVSVLDNKKWRLAPLKHLENIKKIENIGMPLIQAAEIKVGFATLKDAVFFFPDPARVPDIEHEITRPAIKVADLTDQESINAKVGKIIHPYKKNNGKWQIIEPYEFMDKYPLTFEYLQSHKALLLKRDKGKKKYSCFYEWGRTQGMDAPGPKLLTKTFSRGPKIFLDKSNALFCNGYSIKPVLPGLSVDILQKILTSCVMDYYSRLTSFQIGGNYQCFQKNQIQCFGIPELRETDILEISRVSGKKLNQLLCEIYNLHYTDILEIMPPDI